MDIGVNGGLVLLKGVNKMRRHSLCCGYKQSDSCEGRIRAARVII